MWISHFPLVDFVLFVIRKLLASKFIHKQIYSSKSTDKQIF